MPIVKKVGTEVATEVAYKMVSKEIDRQRTKLQAKVSSYSEEKERNGRKTHTITKLGTRMAAEIMDSQSLKTGLGAVLGTISAASSASMKKEGGKELFPKRAEGQRKKKRETESRKEEPTGTRRKYGRL